MSQIGTTLKMELKDGTDLQILGLFGVSAAFRAHR